MVDTQLQNKHTLSENTGLHCIQMSCVQQDVSWAVNILPMSTLISFQFVWFQTQ